MLRSIKGVVFDMDGIIIDSEPIWRLVMSDCFLKVGVNITEGQYEKTQGIRISEIIKFYYEECPWDKGKISLSGLEEMIVDGVLEAIKKKNEMMIGVREALLFLKDKGYLLAIASSSPRKMIEGVCNHFGFDKYFSIKCSGYDELFGKPHPAVYIRAVNLLGLNPEECLAIEDSLNGVIAAKAARMKCISIPEISNINNRAFGLADFIIDDLSQINDDLLGGL